MHCSISLPFSLALLAIPLLAHATPLASRQAVIPPPECNVITPFTVTTFAWFNSTHNLDCVNGPDVGDGTTCFNRTSSGGIVICDPSQGPCLECGVPVCATGIPYDSPGYGPPDTVAIDISVPNYNCFESNPQQIRRDNVGNGVLQCGGSVAYHINFFGNSNNAVGTGHIDFAPINSWTCKNGSTITGYGSVDFPVLCTHDAEFNATCTAHTPFDIPLLGYTIS